MKRRRGCWVVGCLDKPVGSVIYTLASGNYEGPRRLCLYHMTRSIFFGRSKFYHASRSVRAAVTAAILANEGETK